MSIRPFHLAIPVKDLDETRDFYTEILGFETGRSSDTWVDLNCYGHQLVLHISDRLNQDAFNPVDGHDVPVPHFGVILQWKDWENLAAKLKDEGVSFIIEPYIRFKGESGEQATMFFKDPSQNNLEFKAFKNDDQIFLR
jgi:hypothetical protein